VALGQTTTSIVQSAPVPARGLAVEEDEEVAPAPAAAG
jgi:hypothetical protein